MTLLGKLRQYFKGKRKEMAPEKGYDIWAVSYDDQPDNLMLALDEAVFGELAAAIAVEDKMVIDVGCGTGRHWKKIMERCPKQLVGYDVSEGMLARLKQKFPAAKTLHLSSSKLYGTGNASCDVLISTLTMAHIENAREALQEWNRVLKKGAHIIITDYHPEVLEKGGRRTFRHNGRTVGVRNHIHSLEQLQTAARQLNWELIRLAERKIDDTVRSYYEKQHALHVFDSFKGMPVIYGMLFKKTNAV